MTHSADGHDLIRVQGARVNNLRDVSVELPKRHDGGRVVFEGTPGDLVASRSTLTGQYLAEYVSTGP